MRSSNQLTKNYLLDHAFDHIFFKPHSRRQDVIYTQRGTYLATDFFNLFDGLCFDHNGNVIFFQVKTNAWANETEITDFLKEHKITVLSFNVTNKKNSGKWIVLVRRYDH